MTSSRTHLRVLMSGISLFALAGTMPALAQQAPPATAPAAPAAAAPSTDDSEVITVTGFRASLQSALDNKRNSDLIIESVAPEDIGKMPDQDVAESLQRLPGVQIDRSSGIGTSVLIDGLRQNLTTLNGDIFLTGREFYVSGEASGGGAGANSQYDSLEGIPSEEIGGIDVYKTPKASMSEGGLGGTIDLKTRNPLDGPDGLQVGGNFRMSNAQNRSDWTPDGTLVASYKFDDRFAITGSFSYDNETTHTNEMQDANRGTWIVTNSATAPYAGGYPVIGTLPQSYIDPQLMYFTDIDENRTTIGSSFGATWRPTDALTLRANWFYSHLEVDDVNQSDKVWFNGSGAAATAANPNPIPGIDPTKPYSIDGNGVVQNGTFTATGAETSTLAQETVTSANNFQFNADYDPGGPLRGNFDIAYAYAQSNLQAAQTDQEHSLYTTGPGAVTNPLAPGCSGGGACAPPGPANPGYQFTYSNGGSSGLPSVSYLAPFTNLLSDPNYGLFKSNWAWANLTSNQQFSTRGDLDYTPDFIKQYDGVISAGIRYATRDVTQDFGRYLINGEGDGNVSTPGAGPWIYYQDPGYGSINVPYSTFLSNPGRGTIVNNFGVGPIAVSNPGPLQNPATFLESVWAGAGVPNMTEQFFTDPLSSFDVTEQTTAGYLMADFGGANSGFHANFGVRIVHTDLNINNAAAAKVATYYGTAPWNGVDSNAVPTQYDRNYWDVLPSANFVLDISDDQKLRLGVARVVSPQDLFSLGLGQSYNFTREVGDRVNINTGLKDGFEFIGGTAGNPELDPYRATQGNFSYEYYLGRSGLFSAGGFYKQVANFVESQNVPTFVMDDFGGTINNVTTPENAGQGRIYGVELGAQYALDNGIGFAANYTRSESSSAQKTSFTNNAQIPGVSNDAVTAQLYYEHEGFAARMSYSWRDEAVNDSAVGATFNFQGKTYQVYSAPYGQLDMQLNYDINRNFGLVFQAINLTDESQHTYLQWPDEPFTYDNSGRRFFLGGKFKF